MLQKILTNMYNMWLCIVLIWRKAARSCFCAWLPWTCLIDKGRLNSMRDGFLPTLLTVKTTSYISPWFSNTEQSSNLHMAIWHYKSLSYIIWEITSHWHSSNKSCLSFKQLWTVWSHILCSSGTCVAIGVTVVVWSQMCRNRVKWSSIGIVTLGHLFLHLSFAVGVSLYHKAEIVKLDTCTLKCLTTSWWLIQASSLLIALCHWSFILTLTLYHPQFRYMTHVNSVAVALHTLVGKVEGLGDELHGNAWVTHCDCDVVIQ